MPGAVGDVLDQDPEAWRDAVETSAYVADNSALRKREREFLPLSPPSWKDFARFETRVVEGIGQEDAFDEYLRNVLRCKSRSGSHELGLSAHSLSTACPHLRAPGAPCPGWAHHIAGSLPETAGQRGADDLIPDNGQVERMNR
jgi:hypothetical protein